MYFFTSITTIFLGIIFYSSFSTTAATNETCYTSACEQEATSIVNSMNFSADPCDDFYNFACGNYHQLENFPDLDRVDSFTLVVNKIEKTVKHDIENNINEDDPEAFKKLKTYYETCVKANNETLANELLDILNQLGGWPILDGGSWDESTFDWRKTVNKIAKMGYLFDYFIDVNMDSKNVIKHVIHLKPRINVLSTKKLILILNSISTDNTISAERVKEELGYVRHFEKTLPRISSDKESMSLSKLEMEYPDISWTDLINGIFGTDMNVETSNIIVMVPTFFKSYFKLISKTPKRTIANYLMSNIALEINLIKSEPPFSKNAKPNWKQCIQLVKENIPTAYKALYVRKHFDLTDETRNNIVEMVANIREIFRELFEKSDWLNEKTEQKTLEKLDNIIYQIGYPSEFLDDKKLDDYYQNLKMNPESFIENRNNIFTFKQSKYIENQRRPKSSRNDWTRFGILQGTNFLPTDNAIELTVEHLNEIFFSSDRPQYVNYGMLGFFAAHEFSHAYDAQGITYDKEGNDGQWWDPESKKEYENRIHRLDDQYEHYMLHKPYQDVKINAISTENENIADNAGTLLAYYAYNKWERQNKREEPHLPGFDNFTSQQMFWISYATALCTEYRNVESFKKLFQNEEHPPEEARVNIPLSNYREFSKDFNCPQNSKMNPDSKNVIWSAGEA